ncbi:MAG: TM2 domain-containing protein [Sphingobacteriales bacterium]|nr:MAG: TM2 domain-containing protein [Sphingobacteriales bacterium]
MESQKVDMYLVSHSKFFEGHNMPMLKEMLTNADDSRFITLQSANLKDPTMMLIISILAGSLGVDRFVLGETGLGIAKLLTCGGLGIWTIVDWFLIMGKTKEMNVQKVYNAVM